ncbi:TonB C-terminal domain-containing protein [Propylenella binzhouense]|uniref:Cell envelope biogenesis protein TolA n=1 Tax=Propylenella binzhouense TaxID=2555902 RepID=A0A964WTK9_9HYPH|nr:TonB C-terminal domain-containing protein [Propylenella binzhouense]MYZ48127.1 cell envelope biogenesis protein TolA [Propylenella binzhouense]
MRVGLGVSIAGHLAILAIGFVAFPEARPFTVDPIEALPVELVTVSDKTDLLQGDKKAEKAPDEKPQPKATVKAPQPAPKAAEKPAEKIVEAAREPAPPPPPEPAPKVAEKPPAPPPPAEPEPKPVRDVMKEARPEPPKPKQLAALPKPPEEPAPKAAEPKPAEAKPEPEPAAAAEAPQPPAAPPRSRPAPPKQMAEAKPQPAKPATPEKPKVVAEAKPDKPKFDTNDIAALLNKQEAQGGGDPNPRPEPQTLGSIDGRAEAAMTQSEIEALKAMLYRCWNPPRGVREAGSLSVTVAISLLPDGSLASAPRVVSGVFDSLSQIAAESALRAVQVCAPYTILPSNKYEAWRQIEFTFDPREMLGG